MALFDPKFINSKKPARTDHLVTVGRVEDVPLGCGAVVELANDCEVALFNIGGKFYAIENFCPHRGMPLADGALCDHVIECARHGWRFDARTGRCLSVEGTDVETYEVIVEDGYIKVKV